MYLVQIDENIIKSIKNGSVGVMPTDTIYGIVASVFSEKAIQRVSQLKGRDASKRYIVLIAGFDQLLDLGIHPSKAQLQTLKNLWKNPVSVDLKCSDKLEYLHNGRGSLAVRLPADKYLQEVLTKTGPIIATSANKSGQPLLKDMNEIKQVFPDLDFYVEGPAGNKPSRLARLDDNGKIEWLERKS